MWLSTGGGGNDEPAKKLECCGLGWQKKGGREKLVSITKGRSRIYSAKVN
jgi:hypothetical protein